MRLIYHPDAEKELAKASKVYERAVPGLGNEFLDAVDRAIGVIHAAPERWRILDSDVRRYLMARFPYAIYFRVGIGEIRILAIKHHRQHPDYWRYRQSE